MENSSRCSNEFSTKEKAGDCYPCLSKEVSSAKDGLKRFSPLMYASIVVLTTSVMLFFRSPEGVRGGNSLQINIDIYSWPNGEPFILKVGSMAAVLFGTYTLYVLHGLIGQKFSVPEYRVYFVFNKINLLLGILSLLNLLLFPFSAQLTNSSVQLSSIYFCSNAHLLCYFLLSLLYFSTTQLLLNKINRDNEKAETLGFYERDWCSQKARLLLLLLSIYFLYFLLETLIFMHKELLDYIVQKGKVNQIFLLEKIYFSTVTAIYLLNSLFFSLSYVDIKYMRKVVGLKPELAFFEVRV